MRSAQAKFSGQTYGGHFLMPGTTSDFLPFFADMRTANVFLSPRAFQCVALEAGTLFHLYKEWQQVLENLPCKIPFRGLLCNPRFQTFVLLLCKCGTQELTDCYHSLSLHSAQWKVRLGFPRFHHTMADVRPWLTDEVLQITVSDNSIFLPYMTIDNKKSWNYANASFTTGIRTQTTLQTKSSFP